MLFLAFVGGALVGGTAASLFTPCSGPEARRRIAGAARGSRELGSRMPQAIRDASRAAQAAFASALKESAPACPSPNPRNAQTAAKR